MERYKITTEKENNPGHMSILCSVTDNYSSQDQHIPHLRWEGDYECISAKVMHVSPELVTMFELGQFLDKSMDELELLVLTTDPLIVGKMIREVEQYISHVVIAADQRSVRERADCSGTTTRHLAVSNNLSGGNKSPRLSRRNNRS